MGRLRNIGNRLRAGGGGGFSPVSLFAAGEDGVWNDPPDFTSQFQDSIGATQVTATAQAVGILLDKRLALALGTEQISAAADRTFSSNTGFWTKDAGISIGGGLATWSAAVATSQIVHTSLLTVGQYYEVGETVSGYVQGNLGFNVGPGGTGPVRSANGANTARRMCTGDGRINWISSGASTSLSITNVTVKPVTGNHAIQSTAGSRPIESVISSMSSLKFDGLDDFISASSGGGGTAGFFFCAAINASALGANQTLFSDVGTNTGYRVRLSATNNLELAAGNGVAFTTAATAAAVSSATTYVVTAWHDGVNLNCQINLGTAATAAFATATAGTAAFTLAASNGGASGFFNGYIGQVVYRKDSGLTSAQRTQVQQYVATKAGISI